jgi:exonuclease III
VATSTLSNLSFSAQNCNSLNISTNCPKQVKKIAAILALQTTFVFLSDLRLNSDTNTVNNFFSPRYQFFHNSTTNRRGVGILINSQLIFSNLVEIKDKNNNILGIRLRIENNDLLLISVYGPNTNDIQLFNDLRDIILKNSDCHIICAGDWNLNFSTQPVEENIDVLNMCNPPSLIRSGWLQEICECGNLTDPFRALNYNKRDFTFVPRTGARNRSRIDFF